MPKIKIFSVPCKNVYEIRKKWFFFFSGGFSGEILMGWFFLPCYYFEMTWVTTHLGWSVGYVHAHTSVQVIPELINEGSFRNSQWGQRQESELQAHILVFYSTHIRKTVILLKPNLQFAV